MTSETKAIENILKMIFSGTWANPDNIKRIVRIAMIIIPLALLGNIIYVVLSATPGLFSDLITIDYRYLIFAMILALFPWLGQSTAIKIWARHFKVDISYRQSLNCVLSSDIGAAVTPTMLGGGYAKLALLINYGFRAHEATLVTFLGSLADAVFFAIALPLAIYKTRTWENPHIIAIWHNLLSHWPTAVIVCLILFIIFLIIRRYKSNFPGEKVAAEGSLMRKILNKLSRFKDNLISASKFTLAKGKIAFLVSVILSGIGWCGRYGAITALVIGLGYSADPILFFLLQWVVFTTMTLIPTPGAIGGAEVSFTLIYSGLIPESIISVVTVAWRFITFYFIVALASVIFAISWLPLVGKGRPDSDSRKDENV